jgi:hypothetical protein
MSNCFNPSDPPQPAETNPNFSLCIISPSSDLTSQLDFSSGPFMPGKHLDQTHRAKLTHRQKVVIGHPLIGRGGSEARVMWLIEALKPDFDVTIMTTGGWDLPALNSYYGTQVAEDEVKVRIAPLPFLAHSLNAAALRGACFQQFARQIAEEYDIRISAYNPTDWGLPALHFIADFSWNPEIREKFHPSLAGLHLPRYAGSPGLSENRRSLGKVFGPGCSPRRPADRQFSLDRQSR